MGDLDLINYEAENQNIIPPAGQLDIDTLEEIAYAH